MSPELVAVLSFACIAVILYIIARFIQSEAAMRDRLNSIRRTPNAAGQTGEAKATLSDQLPTIDRWLSRTHLTENLLLSLVQAGVKLKPSEFIGITAGITLGLAALVIIFSYSIPLLILTLLLGMSLPFQYLNVLQKRRIIQFNKQLPDALSLITSSLRTGYSFSRAMQIVSEEMMNPISEEFKRTLDETNIGVSLESALQHLMMRVKSYDLELVLTAVMIQQQIGGNLAEVLDNIARTIRERVQVEGEISALTAEGRLSGVVLVALPIFMAFVISILNPEYISLLITKPVGRMLIFFAVLSQLIGALVIKRMIALDF